MDNYYFSANNKDCPFLEFDMPHMEQPLQLIILSIKVNKYKKLIFPFVFKVMEYSQTYTQEFNLNQEKKKIFFATPSPSRGGGGELLQPPPPPNFWNDSPRRKLLPQFGSAYSYKRVNWRSVFKVLNAKTLKEKNKSGGEGLQQPPPPPFRRRGLNNRAMVYNYIQPVV